MNNHTTKCLQDAIEALEIAIQQIRVALSHETIEYSKPALTDIEIARGYIVAAQLESNKII